MTTFNEMQQVKRQFFALRNGIIADTIRKAGLGYNIIFGLNIPQLKQIAESIGKNKFLAESLRDNVTTRESLLLAPMIYPAEELTLEDAYEWASDCRTYEVADILCHSLLRHHDQAHDLCHKLTTDTNTMARYAGLRLFLCLNLPLTDSVRSVCETEIHKNSPLKGIAFQVLDR